MNWITLLIVYSIQSCWSGCTCGRGGLCFKYKDASSPGINAKPCHCDIVSARIFKDNMLGRCSAMVKHCNPKSCIHGKCHDGFGTFICICEEKWSGPKCNFQFPDSDHSEFITLWYRVTQQKTWVPTISALKITRGTHFIFTFDDNRVLVMKYELCTEVTKDSVMERCKEGGDGPDCTVLAFTSTNSKQFFNCKVILPFVQERAVYIEGFKGPVGSYHDVKVKVSFRSLEYTADLLNATYRVFLETGDLMRKCPYHLTPSGCGATPDTAPSLLSTSEQIFSVSAVFDDPQDCPVKSKDYEWYLSEMVEREGLSLIGNSETISATPSRLGLRNGTAVIIAKVTFKELVGMEDETSVAICYVSLFPRKLVVQVDAEFLRYPCGVEIKLHVEPTVINLKPEDDQPIFTWVCPTEICTVPEVQGRVLSIVTTIPCEGSYHLMLRVDDEAANYSMWWMDKLTVVPGMYLMTLQVEPVVDTDTLQVNPLFPVTITATDTLNTSHGFNWTSNLAQLKYPECYGSSNVFQIPANTLEPNAAYLIEVTMKNEAKNVTIHTLKGPYDFVCSIAPKKGQRLVDKFNISCTAKSRSPPLTYYLYEGEAKDLVLLSPIGNITNVSFSHTPVWVDVEDYHGMRKSTKIEFTLNFDDKIEEYTYLLNSIPMRIERLYLFLHEDDFLGVAREIDWITKLTDIGFPFYWHYILMKSLAQIKVCHWLECIIKTINSIRRLLAVEVSEKLGGVDEFILFGGGAIFQMSQNMSRYVDKMHEYGAYTMIPLLSSIHSTAQELIDFVDPLFNHPTLDQDIRQIHYRKIERGNFYARKAIAEIGLFITKHIPHKALPFELISEDQAEQTTVVSHFPDMINCIAASNKSKSYIQFSEEAMNKLNATGPASVALVHYRENEFWWSVRGDYSYGGMVEVHVYCQTAGKWAHVFDNNGTIHTYITAVETEAVTIAGEAYMPNESSGKLDEYVNVYRIIVPRGHGAIKLRFADDAVGGILNIVTTEFPTYKTTGTNPLIQSQVWYKYYSNNFMPNVYIGILAKSSNVAYSFNLSLILCVKRSERMWKSEMCKLIKSTSDMTQCICEHMSLLSVVALAPRCDRTMMLTVHMNTTKTYNWYALAMIVGFLSVLTLFYITGLVIGYSERSTQYAIFFEDNWPEDVYPYLVAAYTGGRFMSGTTSHVAIQLIGQRATSRVHVMMYHKKSVPLTWGHDCWFVIFTPTRLGKIQGIEMWHDAFGCQPDWYCTEVIIWDITTGSRFNIPIQMWLSYTNLYRERDTKFVYKTTDFTQRRKWQSYVQGHIYAKLRQEHHWISVILLHPRSHYTRLDRLMIVTVIVMVTVAASMAFYFENLGPTDILKVKVTIPDLYLSIKAAIIATLAVIIPAQLFSIGRNELLKDVSQNKAPLKLLVRRFFLYPVMYNMVETQDKSEVTKPKWSTWIWLAYIVSLLIISATIVFIIGSALNLGSNRSIVWLIVCVIALGIEGLVINPLQILMASILVAFFVRRSARNIVTINIDPRGDYNPTESVVKRLDRAFHNRVKPMYKPPLSSQVKDAAIKEARRKVFDVFLMIVFGLYISLITLLAYYTDKGMKFQKHIQLSELFDQRLSKEDLRDIQNQTRYFHYLRGTILQTLHRYTWYNRKPLRPDWNGTVFANDTFGPTTKVTGFCTDYTTKLIGVPQLRQQRVTPESNTSIAPEFRRHFQHAHGHLETLTEDTKTYLPNWDTPKKGETYYKTFSYQFQGMSVMPWFYGIRRRTYDTGGYVENLHWTLGVSQSLLVDLEVDRWLDNLTRIIFFTFNVYNLFEEKISYVTIITECLPSGVYRSRSLSESTLLGSHRLLSELMIGLTVSCLAIVVTIHFYRTMATISKHGFVKYLKSISGLINISVVVTGYGLVAAFINRYFQFLVALEEIETAEKDAYTSLHSRFNQNHIALISIGAFTLSVVALGSLLFHNLMGFEAIDTTLARTTRALLVTLSEINLFAVYISLCLIYFGSGAVPNLFLLQSFKDSIGIQDTLALASYNTNFLLIAVIFFQILASLNLVILVQMYAKAAALMEPKSVVFVNQMMTLGSRLHLIQALKSGAPNSGPPLGKTGFQSGSKRKVRPYAEGLILQEKEIRPTPRSSPHFENTDRMISPDSAAVTDHERTRANS